MEAHHFCLGGCAQIQAQQAPKPCVHQSPEADERMVGPAEQGLAATRSCGAAVGGSGAPGAVTDRSTQQNMGCSRRVLRQQRRVQQPQQAHRSPRWPAADTAHAGGGSTAQGTPRMRPSLAASQQRRARASSAPACARRQVEQDWWDEWRDGMHAGPSLQDHSDQDTAASH
jgi:hypothetical protein